MHQYQEEVLSDLLNIARTKPFPVPRNRGGPALALWPACPCGAREATMQGDLFAGVNEPSDPRNLSDLEKRHTPVVLAPDVVRAGQPFDVEIEVGAGLPHAAEPGHFIQFIELYADDLYLTRADFAAGRIAPRMVVSATLHRPAKEIRAYANCNLHGVWVGRRAISFLE
jgi:superoxide reductase